MEKRINRVKTLTVAVLAALSLLFSAIGIFRLTALAYGETEEIEIRESVLLDADLEHVWLEKNGEVLQDTSMIKNDNEGIAFGNGSTKAIRSPDSFMLSNGDYLSVILDRKYKASFIREVRLVYCGSNGMNVTTTGYSLTDAAFENGGGSSVQSGNYTPTTLTLDPGKIADENGYIQGFVIRATGAISSIRYYFDSVELVAFSYEDAMPERNVVIDANGTDLTMQVKGNVQTGIHDDNAGGMNFGNGSTKLIVCDKVISGDILTIRFAKKYKAANFESVVLRYCATNGNGLKVKTTGYALSDPSCTVSAGSASQESGYSKTLLTLDASTLADENGYIGGFFICPTATDGSVELGYYVDYVELVIDTRETIDVRQDKDVNLDVDGVQVRMFARGQESKYIAGNSFGLFGDDSLQLGYVAIGNGETINVRLDKKYKAENLESVEMTLRVGNNDTTKTITTTVYSTYDKAFTTPVCQVESVASNELVVLTIDPEKISDENGYVGSFVIRKSQDATESQYFADCVVLRVKRYVESVGSNLTLDFDGNQAKLFVGNTEATYENDNLFGLFGNGSTKMACTSGVGNEDVVTVLLDGYYKADLFSQIELCLVIGNTTADNLTTTGFYASSDDAFASPVCEIVTGADNTKVSVLLDASDLADENGYISSFRIRRTNSVDGAKGQIFADFARLLLTGYWTELTAEDSLYGVYKTEDGRKIEVNGDGIDLVGYTDTVYDIVKIGSDGRIFAGKDCRYEAIDLTDGSVFTKFAYVEVAFFVNGNETSRETLVEGETIGKNVEAPAGYLFKGWTNENGEAVVTVSTEYTSLDAAFVRNEISEDAYAGFYGKYRSADGDAVELKEDRVGVYLPAEGEAVQFTYYLLAENVLEYAEGEIVRTAFYVEGTITLGEKEFEKLSVYTVTFFVGDAVCQTQKVYEGECVAMPEPPEKEGFLFKGWFTAADGGNAFDFDSAIGSDISVYAVFEKTEPESSSVNDNSSESSSENENSSVPEQTSSGGGCLGEVSSSAIVGVSLLALAAAYLLKKKKNKKD